MSRAAARKSERIARSAAASKVKQAMNLLPSLRERAEATRALVLTYARESTLELLEQNRGNRSTFASLLPLFATVKATDKLREILSVFDELETALTAHLEDLA